MWATTDRFKAALAGSHEAVSRVDLLDAGVPQVMIDGTTGDADLTGGSVTVGRSVVRRQCDVDLADVDRSLTPADATSLLAPLRGEIRLWRGVRFPDATWAEQRAGTDVELVPVGTFIVVDVDMDYPTIRVSGADRMRILAESKFLVPFAVAAGTNVATALGQLLATVLPTSKLALNLPTTDATTGALVYDAQDSPADAATALANAAGWSLYADPMGVITATSEPDPAADPVAATYAAGPGSMLLKARRGLSGAGVFNAVVATGEDPALTAPVRGYAEDTDPTSITYARATGVFPRFYGSPLLRTNEQAAQAALTILRREGGIADTVAVAALPDPSLEAGDVIRVDDTRGIARLLVVDSFGVSLGAAAQEIVCRSTVVH
jgi:Domain of unknown function (DUF5047)